VYPVLLENRPHRVVASDLASVVRVLQVMLADVLPEPLDRLRAGELACMSQGHKHTAESELTAVSPPRRLESAGERVSGFCIMVSSLRAGGRVRQTTYMEATSPIDLLLGSRLGP